MVHGIYRESMLGMYDWFRETMTNIIYFSQNAAAS